MLPLGSPLYDQLEPKHLRLKDRPPNAPSYLKFLVDGHNCIYQLAKTYQAQWNFVEDHFFRMIREYRQAMLFYYGLTVDFDVFMDDYKSNMSYEDISEGLRIYNCASKYGRDAADIEIVEVVRFSQNPEILIVASSDRYCREVEDFGTKLFKAAEFLELLRTLIPPDYIENYSFTE